MAEQNKEVKDKMGAQEEAPVPIEWHISEGIITRFATNMVVQFIEHEFKITFFELQPSIRLDKSDPLPKSVRADCVASVIVTTERLEKFVEVLQAQLNQVKETAK
jgi:hypothetical protein